MPRTFNGTSQVFRETNTNAPIADYPFSIAVWFYPTFTIENGAGEWNLWTQEGGSTTWTILRIDDDEDAGNMGKLQANARDGGGFVGNIQSTNLAQENEWNHCFLARASGDHVIILNGDDANKGTSAAGTVAHSSHDDYVIGAFEFGGTTSDYWAGYMAWHTLWNVRLSNAEGLALAAGAHPMRIRPEAIVRCYPLWEPSATDQGQDLSQNGDNIPNSNSPGVTIATGPPVVPYVPGVNRRNNLIITPAAAAGAAANKGWFSWRHA